MSLKILGNLRGDPFHAVRQPSLDLRRKTDFVWRLRLRRFETSVLERLCLRPKASTSVQLVGGGYSCLPYYGPRPTWVALWEAAKDVGSSDIRVNPYLLSKHRGSAIGKCVRLFDKCRAQWSGEMPPWSNTAFGWRFLLYPSSCSTMNAIDTHIPGVLGFLMMWNGALSSRCKGCKMATTGSSGSKWSNRQAVVVG